jgi:hypothetical protein
MSNDHILLIILYFYINILSKSEYSCWKILRKYVVHNINRYTMFINEGYKF